LEAKEGNMCDVSPAAFVWFAKFEKETKFNLTKKTERTNFFETYAMLMCYVAARKAHQIPLYKKSGRHVKL
jgi:hypothetical protein